MILLPGTNFDSAATLVSSGSVAALMNITNPDGTTDNLLLDIHKYLDEDNSGTHMTCTTNNIDAFTTVTDALRQAGRKGFVSESGASSDSTVSEPFFAPFFPCPLCESGLDPDTDQNKKPPRDTVHDQLLCPKHLHQPKRRRLGRPGRLGRGQLRDKLHPQPDADGARGHLRRQPGHAAVSPRRVEQHNDDLDRRERERKLGGSCAAVDHLHHARRNDHG